MRGIPIEKVIGNERVVTALGLVAVVGWSWLYLWTGAGTGMSALDMTALTLFPHRLKDSAGGMETTVSAAILMWWTMMIAMMTPGRSSCCIDACCGITTRPGAIRRFHRCCFWPVI